MDNECISIYDFAMKQELEGEALYRSLSKKLQSPGFRLICNWLADQEHRHYTIIQKIKTNTSTLNECIEGTIPTSPLFKEVIANNDNFINEIDLLEAALEQEQNSFKFYAEKANETHSVESARLFLKISDEEKNHETILKKLINHYKLKDKNIDLLEPEEIE